MEGEWVGKGTSSSCPWGYLPPRCHEFSRGSIKMTTVGVMVWSILWNIRKFSPRSLSCPGNVRTSPSYSSSSRWFLFQNPFPRCPGGFWRSSRFCFILNFHFKTTSGKWSGQGHEADRTFTCSAGLTEPGSILPWGATGGFG